MPKRKSTKIARVKFTDAMKSEIIRYVREHNELWNTKNPNYRKPRIVQQRWETLGRMLNHPAAAANNVENTMTDENGGEQDESSTTEKQDADVVKEQWHSLRTYYLSVKKKGMESNPGDLLDGTTSECNPRWIFFKDMEFLSDTMQARVGSSYVAAQYGEQVEEEHEPFLPPESSKPTDSPSRDMSKKDGPDVGPMKEMMIPRPKPKGRVQSHDDFFCSQLASHLKTIPDSLEKEKLKMTIMQDLISFKYQA